MSECGHVWGPRFDNGFYGCLNCPEVLSPEDAIRRLNEHAALKREIKGLREASRAVIHDLTIGDFTSKAGGDAAYLLSIMELRDALLTTEEQE